MLLKPSQLFCYDEKLRNGEPKWRQIWKFLKIGLKVVFLRNRYFFAEVLDKVMFTLTDADLDRQVKSSQDTSMVILQWLIQWIYLSARPSVRRSGCLYDPSTNDSISQSVSFIHWLGFLSIVFFNPHDHATYCYYAGGKNCISLHKNRNVKDDIEQEPVLMCILTFHWLDRCHYADREKITRHWYLSFLVNTSTWSKFGCQHHRGNCTNITSRRLCSQMETSAREVRRN